MNAEHHCKLRKECLNGICHGKMVLNKGLHSLKVVGNEKEEGSGKWQMIDIGLGLW